MESMRSRVAAFFSAGISAARSMDKRPPSWELPILLQIRLLSKEFFERQLITGLGVTNDDKDWSSTTVRPGRHTVHVIVSTWYQTPQLAEKLRQQWQRKGVLWTQPLSSIPVSFVIEKPASAPPCR